MPLTLPYRKFDILPDPPIFFQTCNETKETILNVIPYRTLRSGFGKNVSLPSPICKLSSLILIVGVSLSRNRSLFHTEYRTAKIYKLQVLGSDAFEDTCMLSLGLTYFRVRSFDPQTAETIQFHTPLTLIVGSNGSGKTVCQM